MGYLAGMGENNIAEYGAALEGEEALREHLAAERENLLAVSVDGFIEAFSSLLPGVDPNESSPRQVNRLFGMG